MLMKNPTKDTVRVPELRLNVKPGGTAEVSDGYCLPRKGANTDPIRPIIAMLAPQLIPANEELVDAYRSNKLTEGLVAEPPAPKGAAEYQADGHAPAVAELMASGQAAAAPKANTIQVTKK